MGTPTLDHTAIAAGVPTTVTITSQITDPRLIPASVFLQRLAASGQVTTILGTLHDDGLNGDAVAGDKTFTIQAMLTESVQSNVRLQVSAGFTGLLKRIISDLVTIQVQPSLTVTNAPDDFWATNLGDGGIMFFWANLPDATDHVSIYRATSSKGPWTKAGDYLIDPDIPTHAIDPIDGALSDLYYRMDAISSSGTVLKRFDILYVPKEAEPT
ncbi:MAG: hypothetical protein HY978_04195 [Candidatus Liptonbacteria bacterium]|nr:hypothetical protein [Candidatus Liptonbacteria bacterium]